MDAKNFHRLLKNPLLLDAESLIELEQLVLSYPNSENIRILYALNLLKEKHFKYQENLTKAAFYASSRNMLKYWVDYMVEDDYHHQETSISKHVVENDLEEEATIKPLNVSNTTVDEVQEQSKEKLGEYGDQEERQSGGEGQEEKRNIRTKAELLALVKKRLAEIETLKGEKQSSSIDKSEKQSEVDKMELIDRFIQAAPSISRPDKVDFFDPQQEAVNSTFDEDDFLVTETLAKIHADQGNTEKAKKIYEKLILKFPEKSSYFAALIQDLKK